MILFFNLTHAAEECLKHKTICTAIKKKNNLCFTKEYIKDSYFFPSQLPDLFCELITEQGFVLLSLPLLDEVYHDYRTTMPNQQLVEMVPSS